MSDQDKLIAAGKALYGERWQSDIARDLGVDSRRIRHWLANDRPIPDGVWSDIVTLMDKRKTEIDDALLKVKKSSK